MSSYLTFTCDVCGREVEGEPASHHNPEGLPDGFLRIQITGPERISETADICSGGCAEALAAGRYRRIYGDVIEAEGKP